MSLPATEPSTTPSDVYFGIGENVQTLIKRKGQRNKDLMPLLGISEGAVSHKLKGNSPWTAHEVVLVALHFGVSTDAIYGLVPLPRPSHPGGGARGRRHLYLVDGTATYGLGGGRFEDDEDAQVAVVTDIRDRKRLSA